MMHGPIQLEQLSLVYPHKICFEDFSTQVRYGDRVAIIGRNGAGKSSLLNSLSGLFQLSGKLMLPKDIQFGYVPQIIEHHCSSGAERFHHALTQVLSQSPNCLLLDEPTNHLDTKNRQSLMRLLSRFVGTIVVASHDPELLRMMNLFWHIDKGKINIFKGNYEDYLSQQLHKRATMKRELDNLKEEKKINHQKLMRDQTREKKRRLYGEKKYHGDKLALRGAQGSGERTTAMNRKQIAHKKDEILKQLDQIQLPKIIKPTFSITPSQIPDKILLTIHDGSCGYAENLILSNVNFTLSTTARIAIQGENKCGKTTLMKAILGDPSIKREGQWVLPNKQIIGYLDQHYQTLFTGKTVLSSLQEIVPLWSDIEIRNHLSTFLFFKNEEVQMLIDNLSGGEKARLCLALIAAKTPRLLILDEVTNNLDLETRRHVIQILKAYPGALIVISHDHDFLRSINITDYYKVESVRSGRQIN